MNFEAYEIINIKRNVGIIGNDPGIEMESDVFEVNAVNCEILLFI